MKHNWIIILLVLICIAAVFGFIGNPFVNVSNVNQNSQTVIPSQSTKTASYSASFAIFTNGTFRVFTDPKYHNLSPNVFIESPNVTTILVKKEGITYQDFFNTLPMKLSKDCLTTGTGQTFCNGEKNKLRFFINGIENPNALQEIIKPEDKLLITFGNLTEAQINNQLSQISNP